MLHVRKEVEKIWVYTTTYNQGWWLPYFFNHYSFADRIVVYDNNSTDDTVDVCRKLGAEVNHLPSVGFDEKVLIDCRNNAWKSARGNADWVIVVDPDELVENPSGYAGTILVVRGYEMFGFPNKPSPGTPNDWYSKPCVFKPNHIKEINFVDGCHVANPSGLLQWNGAMCSPTDLEEYPGVARGIAQFNSSPVYSDLKLLHYRYLHGSDRVLQRWKTSRTRLDEANAKEGIAFQYRYDPQQVLRWFEKLATYAEIIM